MAVYTANTISVKEFVNLVSERPGALLLSFTTYTDTRARKTGNPFGKIWKRSRMNVMVNFHYNEGVRRRLEREGKNPDDFTPAESWHQAVLDSKGRMTPFAMHKSEGTLYVRCMHIATVGEPRFYDDAGKELDYAAVKPFLPEKSSYANQGLDTPLVFLTLKLASVKEVTIDGVDYVVDHK